MKKFTLLFLFFLYSFVGYSQFPEGFEGSTTALPPGWTSYQSGLGVNQVWKISSLITTPPFICDGLNSAFIDRENAPGINEDYLVTPQFVVPINGQLRFFSRQAFIGDQNTEYEVRVSTNPDPSILSAYVFVKKWFEFEMNTTFNICQEQTLSISTYAGQTVHLAFIRRVNQTGTSITGDRWLIDRVNVVQECFAPTLGNSTNIGATTATLNWTSATSTMWDLEVAPVSGTISGVPTIENVTATGAIKSYNISEIGRAHV